MQIEENNYQKTIHDLKARIEHLDVTVKELRLVNGEFQAKAQDSSEKFLKINDEMSKLKREQASIESIKLDRDQRIEENRKQISELEINLNEANL